LAYEKNLLSGIFIAAVFFSAHAQLKPKPALYWAVNYATHGSGDMVGVMLQAGLSQTLHKRLSLQYELGGIHLSCGR